MTMVIHARVITRLYYYPPVQFLAHSFAVDSILQVSEAMLQQPVSFLEDSGSI